MTSAVLSSKQPKRPELDASGGFVFKPEWDVATRTRVFHETRGQACAAWVRWLLPLDEQVVLNKDGSMLAVFELSGLDLDSTTNHQVNQARGQILYALEQVQEMNATVWWQVRRRITTDYPTSPFPDPISQFIDDRLHHDFLKNRQYINKHHIVLSLAPASQSMRLMNMLRRSQETDPGLMGGLRALWSSITGAVSGDGQFPYSDATEIAEALEQFHKTADQFAAAMSSVGIRALRGDELGGFLEVTASPTSSLETSTPIPADVYMDTTVPRSAINNGYRDVLHFEWNSDQAWAKTYSLDFAKRKRVSLDMLDALMAAPFEFTLSHVFELQSRSRGERAVDEYGKYHQTRRFPVKAYILAAMKSGDMSGAPVNQVRDDHATEAELIKNEVSAGQTGVGRCYSVVMVQAKTLQELNEASSKCEELLQSQRIQPVHERLHKMSSFAATVPGSQGEIALWRQMTTENFGDLCPLRTLQPGNRINAYLTEQLQHPCPALLTLGTRHRTPFYFTGYVGDLGHGMMIGPSGTGKTSFVNLCWSMYRKYPNARVIGFDKEYSLRPAVVLQGGKYLDLTAASSEVTVTTRAQINPIRAMGEGLGSRHIPFMVEWLELLAQTRGYQLTSEDRLDLERAVYSTVEIGERDPEHLRLLSIVAQLDMTKPLAMALKPWTQGHVNGSYFDNVSDNMDIENLVAMENGAILENEELAAPYMFYSFYRIQTMLRDTKDRDGVVAPTFIYVPEMWYFLRSETFRNKFFDFLVTLRRLNGIVWLDTQSPDQLVKSDIYSALRDNIATTVFTPNAKAMTKTLGDMYRSEFLLTDEEIQHIASGTPKRDYFIKQGGLSRRISLDLQPEVMACIRSDKRAQVLLDRYLDKPAIRSGQSTDWQQAFIKELTSGQ